MGKNKARKEMKKTQNSAPTIHRLTPEQLKTFQRRKSERVRKMMRNERNRLTRSIWL